MTISSTTSDRLVTRRTTAALAVIWFSFLTTLWLMGRQWLSDSGFGLWAGAWTKNTSQWIADPYTTSHVLHGIFFFWFLLPLARWLNLSWRFVAATCVEMGWELLENSPTIIERYRTATAALDYFGDSILNSTCDVLAAQLGFCFAWRLGWRWMLVVILVVELLMLYFVRDNLTLNVLMLVWPSSAIKQWQMGI